MNNGEKKYLCKDFNLPISILDDPYWDYQMDLFDPYYDCRYYEKLFLNRTIKSTSEVVNLIISEIQSTPAYEIFYKKFNYYGNDFDNSYVNRFKKRNFLIEPNVGKTFISIDLVSANFQSMKRFNSELVMGTDSWLELLSLILSKHNIAIDDYVVKSKQLRQIIFGNLEPKYQQTISKNTIGHILTAVESEFNHFGLTHDDITLVNSDEMFIETNNPDAIIEMINEISSSLSWKPLLRINVVKLNKLLDNFSWFVYHINDKVKFANIPKQFLPQAIKIYQNEPITDMDLTFVSENRLARWLTTVLETPIS